MSNQGHGDQNPFDPREFRAPDDIRDLVTPNQRILHEVCDETEAANRAALDDFDPRVPDARVDIALTTSFPEAEAADPQIATSRRQAMLHNLGLSFNHLESGHPDRIFEYTYRDGETNQIRILTRKDGEQIPVFTALGSDKDGNPVERVRLLSYERAADLATRLGNNLDESKLNMRLSEEFGLDEKMLTVANLSFEDKRSMLASFDEIQSMEVAAPDTAVLDRVRKRLVKAMLPGNELMSFVRHGRFAKAQATYQASISGLAAQYGLDAKSARELMKSEQLCRLQALNEQLRFRRRAAKIGIIAMTSTMTLVGMGGGAGMGVVMHGEMNDGTAKAAVIGGLLGAVPGLWMGLERGLRLRKYNRYVTGFSAEFFDNDGLSGQLQQERSLANEYMSLLNQ